MGKLNEISSCSMGTYLIPGAPGHAILSSVGSKICIIAPCLSFRRMITSVINFYPSFLKSVGEIALRNYPRRASFHCVGRTASQKYDGLQTVHQSYYYAFDLSKQLFVTVGLHSYRVCWPSLISIRHMLSISSIP